MAQNMIQAVGDILDVAIASKVSGDPGVKGQIPGVCLTDTDADGKVRLQLNGVYDVSVKGVNGGGNSAVAIGDIIYYTEGDTPKLNKKTDGVRFGYALEAITSGSTDTIKVKLGY